MVNAISLETPMVKVKKNTEGGVENKLRQNMRVLFCFLILEESIGPNKQG